MYYAKKENMSICEISVMIVSVHLMIDDGNFLRIDEILRDAFTSESSPDAIVGMLRASYAIKDELLHWGELLNNAKKWLPEHGCDVKKALIGLI